MTRRRQGGAGPGGAGPIRGGARIRGAAQRRGRGPGTPPGPRVRAPIPIPLRNPKSCDSVWLRPAPRPGTRSQEIHEASACVLATWHCILSALLYVGNGLGHMPAGLLADFLLQRRVLGTAPIRKLFSALRMLLPAAFLVAVPYLGCSSTVAVALLTLALTIISMTGAAFNINHMDVAPGHAGFLLGITNTFGIVAGIIVPTAAGLLISQDPQSGWSNSFFLSAVLNLFGLIFHTAFGSGTIQDWAREDPAVEREPRAWEGAQGRGSTFSHLCPAPDPNLP